MEREPVKKTFKMYSAGKFVRSESGRTLELSKDGEFLANIPWASRKDLRDAIGSSRKAFSGWKNKTAYNRSQILYRFGEMLEDRKNEFVNAIAKQDSVSQEEALKEVELSIDRVIWYAGFADKYSAIYSSVNPVAQPMFNFSSLEAMGVIAIFSPEEPSLLGALSLALPAITAGNTVVLSFPWTNGLIACLLGELIHCSDIPAGTINILTGQVSELLPVASTHMDLNAIVCSDIDEKDWSKAESDSVSNLKRMFRFKIENKEQYFDEEKAQSPLFITQLSEVKTAWHPIATSIGGGAAY